MIRFIEGQALQKQTTVERALHVVVSEGPLVAAARGGAFLGGIGEIAVEPMPVWPTIDPTTGEAEEPETPMDNYRVGLLDALGSKPLRRRR